MDSLRETLEKWGIDSGSANALARRMLDPPDNTIGRDELAGAGDARLLLLAAITAASEQSRFGAALECIGRN